MSSKTPRGRKRLTRFLLPFAAAIFALATCGLVVQAAIKGNDVRTARNVKNSYQIKAAAPGPLVPGRKMPLKITIANNKSYPIWIYRLKISAVIDHAHRAAGCNVARDFRFTQLGKKTFPFKINRRKFRVVRVRSAGKVRKKKQAVFWTLPAKTAKGFPTIEMLDLKGVNQDACKGASIHFKFDSRAESSKKKAKKLAKREKR